MNWEQQERIVLDKPVTEIKFEGVTDHIKQPPLDSAEKTWGALMLTPLVAPMLAGCTTADGQQTDFTTKVTDWWNQLPPIVRDNWVGKALGTTGALLWEFADAGGEHGKGTVRMVDNVPIPVTKGSQTVEYVANGLAGYIGGYVLEDALKIGLSLNGTDMYHVLIGPTLWAAWRIIRSTKNPLKPKEIENIRNQLRKQQQQQKK